MNTYFPITSSMYTDCDKIISTLNEHSLQIKQKIDSQSVLIKINVLALKVIGLASAITMVASLPLALITFTITPLYIAGVSLAISTLCFVLFEFVLNPRNEGDNIVKKHWKALFEALRKGNGDEVLRAADELDYQSTHRRTNYTECLRPLPLNEVNSFIQKVNFLGYLLKAIDSLRNDEEKLCESYAYNAQKYFDSSGYTTEVFRFIKALANSPKEFKRLIDLHNIGNDLHSLDSLLVLSRKTAYRETADELELLYQPVRS